MPVKKLLVIHLGALGDVITSFGALLLLSKNNFRIDLVSRHAIGSIATYSGITHRNFGLDSALFSSIFTENSDEIDPKLKKILISYDMIVLFSFSELLAENIKRCCVKKVLRIPPRPAPDKPIHVGQFLISCLRDEGLLMKTDNGTNTLPVYHDFRYPDFERKRILIHPGSGSRFKNWPFQYFLELENLLTLDGFKPAFILGPAEKEISNLIEKNHTRLNRKVFHPSGTVELAEILKSAAGFIGNDSGVSHLSALIGLPTLVIFGPTDPRRWTPMGRSVEIIRSSGNCQPCFETSLKGCKTMECLIKISPEQVQKKFKHLLYGPGEVGNYL